MNYNMLRPLHRSSVHLLLLFATTLVFIQNFARSDDVLCYETVNDKIGECEDFLGDGVPEEDCCLNFKYGFKRDPRGQCQSCRPADWAQWGSWSPCSVSCEEGVQQRRRVCVGQGDCQGVSVEVQACVLNECCPSNGGWSGWSSWSQCSATCKSGQTQRTRKCNNPLPSCGGRCIGPEKEVDICYTSVPCPIHGQWGNWQPWKACSSTCKNAVGPQPVQTRFRLCNNPPPSHNPPGKQCDGNARDSQVCDSLPFCPVDGNWGAWKKDSECSVTCGIGRVREKRLCDDPPPRYGGKDCEGSNTKNGICNTKVACPVDGQWSEWEEWTKCARLSNESIACKPKAGMQARRRTCEGASPDGKWCEGEYRESRSCYDIENCPLDGVWSEWSSWGLCSSPCGRATRTRHKECQPVYPNYSPIVEGVLKTAEAFFSGTPKVSCRPINGERKKVIETKECRNLPPCV